MRMIVLTCAALGFFVSAQAARANVCQTDAGKTCATGMPLEGYCECNGQGGTVVGGTAGGAMSSHAKPHDSMRPAPTPPPQ